MAKSEAAFRQGQWHGRVIRFVNLTGHLEESDLLWKIIAPEIAACTRAYVEKDVVSWNMHLYLIQRLLKTQKGTLECRPTWC